MYIFFYLALITTVQSIDIRINITAVNKNDKAMAITTGEDRIKIPTKKLMTKI